MINDTVKWRFQAIPRGFRKALDSKTIYKINFIFSVETVCLTHENPMCVRVCVRASASVCCHGYRNMETTSAQ